MNYSLIYPIEVTSLINIDESKKKRQIVMFVGRVHRDIRDIFTSQNFIQQYDILLFCLQTGLILIIIFLALMHYAAVLYYQIDIPLRLLNTYLVQELKRQNINQKYCSQQKESIQKKKQITKSKRNIQLTKISNQMKGDSFVENNDKSIQEQDQLVPQIKLFTKLKNSLNEFQKQNNTNQVNISNLNQQSTNYHNNTQNITLNNTSYFYNKPFLFSQQNQGNNSQQNLGPNQQNQTSQNNLSLYFSPNNVQKTNNFRFSPEISVNDSRLILLKNNKLQTNNLIGTQNLIGSSRNMMVSQQNFMNQYDLKQTPNISQLNQYQNQIQKLKEQNQQQSYQNIILKHQNSNQGKEGKNIMKMSQSPRKKTTNAGGLFFLNNKKLQKQQQKYNMQLIAKQIRTIAVFSEKVMKEVLNIKLSDIPIMSHELKVIISTFQEFSNVIAFLEDGYEQTTNEWEKLSKLRQALQMLKYVKNTSGQSVVYQDIGNIYFDKDDYQQSIQFYELSLNCSLQLHGLQKVSDLLRLINQQTTQASNNSTNSLLLSQSLDINFLRSLIPRLYIQGFAMGELGMSMNPCEILQNANLESLNWLKQSCEHLNACLQICDLIHYPDIKKIEIMIFSRLTLAEIYTHTNELCKAHTEFRKAKLYESQFYEIQSNETQQQQLSQFTLVQIQNFFQYAYGIYLVKQKQYFLGCQNLTAYLEKSTVLCFRRKALKYIKFAFQEKNIDYKKIQIMQNRMNNVYSYDIFILFNSLQKSNSKYDLISQNLQNNNSNKSKQNRGKSQSLSTYINEIQLNVLNFLNQNFLNANDNLFFAGFDSEFKVLQPLFPFKNKTLWLKGENLIKQFLNKNNEQNQNNTQMNRFQSVGLNNISMSNNNNNVDSEAVNSIIKDRNSYVSQSRKDSNQISYNLDNNDLSSKDNNQIGWESSFYYMLKEMIQNYKNHSINDSHNTHKDKKIILLTFSFQNSTQMIEDVSLFEERVQQLTSYLPSKPKIINVFIPMISKTENVQSQKNINLIEEEYQGKTQNDFQIKQNILELEQFVDHLQHSPKSDVSFEILHQNFTNTHNSPKVFPKLNKRRGSRRESLNYMSSNNSQIMLDTLLKDQNISHSNTSTNNEDFSQEKDSNQKVTAKKYIFNGISTTEITNKKESYESSEKNIKHVQQKIIENEDSEVESQDNDTCRINIDQKVQNSNYINQNQSVPQFKVNLKKFYIFFNETQVFYYLTKLRQKNIDLHLVFARFFR